MSTKGVIVYDKTSQAIRDGYQIYDRPQVHRPEWLLRRTTPRGLALAFAIVNDVR